MFIKKILLSNYKIYYQQNTVDFKGEKVTLAAKGRHDPCVVPRAVPIVEAMCALVLADAALIQESRTQSARNYDLLKQVRPNDAQRILNNTK